MVVVVEVEGEVEGEVVVVLVVVGVVRAGVHLFLFYNSLLS